MEYDVVIVGAGPSGLSSACKLKQLAAASNVDISVCVVEKGSEVGAHILSGAILEPRALNELFPDWETMGAPLHTPVTKDEIQLLRSATNSATVPSAFVPFTMHNEGNYIISLGNLCRWLAEQAEALGVEIYPGFAAAEVLYHSDGSVKGIATGDMGLDANGNKKDSYVEGMELHARYTIFAEGCRGSLAKQLTNKFQLNADSAPQHYALGVKELWEIDPSMHTPGLVIHTAGWPLSEHSANGGGFLYHLEDNQVAVGLITDLNYSNTYLSPFEEFQRYKHHPTISQYLKNGKRIAYGARAISKGGIQALPKMSFPGGVLTGCNAGTLNFAKIKGTHTAMKSGMVAAESIFEALNAEQPPTTLPFDDAFKTSWAYEELYTQRNFGPAQHKFGNIAGSAYAFLDLNIFRGRLPWTLSDKKPDHESLLTANRSKKIDYPKPDGVLSFDRLSSVFVSNTNHEEDQPCHLKLKNADIPIQVNLATYDEPAQRYCPAGVYEIVPDTSHQPRLQINAQNCLHCKTCDIKDPTQNIIWETPEGTGGPNYPNM
ncbi:electron transfer flavoprotein-ubiquinone oxidoreductase (plasmid) [Alteromonas sp. I4]|nr:electron transfer flavoprotein-ubiquinone oxidoreductase [Alteromonas sp. I4]